jgi:universal stress protein A
MIRNILVPTDFSDGSKAALASARELAGALGASLHLMHVVQNTFIGGGFGEIYAAPLPADLQAQEAAARANLDLALSEDDKVTLHAVVSTRTGSPAEEILHRLEEDPPIHLVVMATHGRGGVARLVLGSVADVVVRHAGCPVMTVKDHPGW